MSATPTGAPPGRGVASRANRFAPSAFLGRSPSSGGSDNGNAAASSGSGKSKFGRADKTNDRLSSSSSFGKKAFAGSVGASLWLSSAGSAGAFSLPTALGAPFRALFSSTAGGRTQKRVMILMSDTGGGHRASAEALKAGFKARYGDEFAVDSVDIWTEHTPWPFNQLPKSYGFLVKHAMLWRASYYLQQPRCVHRPTMRLTSAFVSEQLSAAFDVYDPDLVVSVHPLMQLVPLRVLRRRAAARARAQAAAVARSGDASALGRARERSSGGGGGYSSLSSSSSHHHHHHHHHRHSAAVSRFDDHHVRDPGQPPPFATVVTDLTTCHNTWFDPRVDACFVPTEECAERARKLGVPREKIIVHGLPIRPGFAKAQPSKKFLRKKLGMDPEMPAVLLVGGGEGMGNLEATVRAIVARGEQAAREAALSEKKSSTNLNKGIQVVAVCGRNVKLAKELNSASWLPRGARVLATGFVDNMEEWMSAADVIVTKAGPGTIAEAIVSGLPMLLNGFIPCQEHGNVAYVTSRGIGAFERDPTKISEILEAWLAPPQKSRNNNNGGSGVSEELAAMRAALRPLRPRFKDALANIVDDLAELCRSGGRALVDPGLHAGHGFREVKAAEAKAKAAEAGAAAA